MKVLLSAIACHPDLGSEAKVGWSTALAVSRIAGVKECHVMTHATAKAAISREQEEGRAREIFFHFFEEPFAYHPSRLIARFQSWLLYRKWQQKSFDRAAQLHAEHGLALAHHVTYASWRMPPPLWRLPIPFVFGPVGGGAEIPPAFRSILGQSARMFEFLRAGATTLSARSSKLKLCCRNSSAVVAADTATAEFLSAHGAKNVHHLCQVFFSDQDASRFNTAMLERTIDSDGLKIFAGGNLEGRKGTRLSLQALALLKRKGIPFSYTYGGWGPDLNEMRNLADSLDIARQIHFDRGYSGSEYIHQLGQSDVYLLPSIRETVGITMMEAMMAGCYPIVLGGTGAGDIIERVGGAVIKAKSPEEAVRRIARQLEWCFTNRRQMRQNAETAGLNVRQLYSEQAYQKAIFDIYSEAIERPCGHYSKN